MAHITLFEQGDIRIIEIIGRLDGNSSPEFARVLDQILDHGLRKIVLDMGSVDYISSPGLREIVRVFKRVKADGGDLRIANPSDPVMAVMRLAGLDDTLQIYTTRSAAVTSF